MVNERYSCETNDHYVREQVQGRARPYASHCVTYRANTGGSSSEVTQHVCAMHAQTDRSDERARAKLPKHVPGCRDGSPPG